MLSLFISSALCWYDTSGKKIEIYSAEEWQAQRAKRRKISSTVSDSQDIGDFTFYNFSLNEFDINKTGRMMEYSMKKIYTMAMWFGKGEGPILTMVRTYSEGSNEESLIQINTNTIIYTTTTTCWLFPTWTNHVLIQDLGYPVTYFVLAAGVVFFILTGIGAFTEFNLIKCIFGKCVRAVHVHRHRTHHHNWTPPAPTPTTTTTPSQNNEAPPKQELHSSLILNDTKNDVPIVTPNNDPYAQDYEKTQITTQPENPYSDVKTAQDPYAGTQSDPYAAAPGPAPAPTNPYAATPGPSDPYAAVSTDPYSNAAVQPPAANPDDDW